MLYSKEYMFRKYKVATKKNADRNLSACLFSFLVSSKTEKQMIEKLLGQRLYTLRNRNFVTIRTRQNIN